MHRETFPCMNDIINGCGITHVYIHMNSGYTCTHTAAENCEGWLSPGGHSSGGRALTAKVRGPWFNPGWLPVFLSSLKIFLSLSSLYWQYCHTCMKDVTVGRLHFSTGTLIMNLWL